MRSNCVLRNVKIVMRVILCYRHAIVEELAGFGARIHTCSRNEKELNQRIEEWKEKGFQVSGSVCDLSSTPQREHLIQTVASLFGGTLNILVSLIHTHILC